MVTYYYKEFLPDSKIDALNAKLGSRADETLQGLKAERDADPLAFLAKIEARTAVGIQSDVVAAKNDIGGAHPPIPAELVAHELAKTGIPIVRINEALREIEIRYDARAAQASAQAQSAPAQWAAPGRFLPEDPAQITYGQPVQDVIPPERSGEKSRSGRFALWIGGAVATAATAATLTYALLGGGGGGNTGRINNSPPPKPETSTSVSTGNTGNTNLSGHADVYFNANSAGAPIVSTLINGQTANEPDASPASIQAAIKSAAGSGASRLVISGDPIISGNQARQVEALLEEAAQAGELNGLKAVTISPVSANPGDVQVAIDTINKAAGGRLEVDATIKSTEAAADAPACYVSSSSTPVYKPDTAKCNTR